MQMKRVKVSILVNDYAISGVGVIENNILKIKNNDEYIRFNLKDIIFEKKTKELSIILDFKNKVLKYSIPETDKEFYNEIKVLSLTNSDKEYNIMYQMEEKVFNLKITYEKEK